MTRLLLALAVALAALGCRRVAPPPPPPQVPRTQAAATDGARALHDLCRHVAVRVPKRARLAAGPAPDAALPQLPSAATRDPALRRLEALRLIDDLTQRLEKAPRSPALHFLIGRVHLETLENTAAAEGHLCRALLEEPRNDLYRLTLRSAWLAPGFEERLEASLASSERQLPWREALADVRRLKGLDGPEQGRAFEDAIAAMAVVRAGAKLRRERVTATLDDLAAALADWTAGAVPPEALHVIVTYAPRYASRTESLHDRAANGTPRDVWPSLGRTRAYLHAHGKGALQAVLALAGDRLRGTTVTLYVAAGDKHLVLTGRIAGPRMTLVSFAAAPDVPAIRAVVKE